MPYSKYADINPSLKGIKPPISLGQANAIAAAADKTSWPIAISSFKKGHRVVKGKWVKKMGSQAKEFSGGDVMTLTVGDKQVSISELVAAYQDKEETPAEECESPYVPSSVISFKDLDAVQQAQDTSHEVEGVVDSYTKMIWNIVYRDEQGFNRLTVLKTLSDEFLKRLDETISNPESAKPGEVAEKLNLSESYEVEISQDDTPIQEGGDPDKPTLARLDVQIIRPGWGNSRDNNYYSSEMLKKTAQKFVGAKMYESQLGLGLVLLRVSRVS